MKATTLVILAAGFGTRYGGLKQLEPITEKGETILDFSIFDALGCGIPNLVFVVRREILGIMQDSFGLKLDGRAQVSFLCQDEFGPDKRWGTGHAVLSVKKAVADNFLVINADDFYGRPAFELMTAWDASPELPDFALAGYRLDKTLSDHGPVSRGECLVSNDGKLSALLEREAVLRDNSGIFCNNGHRLSANTTVSMNFWAFTPRVFEILESRFAGFVKAESGDREFFLNEALSDAVLRKEATIEVLETESEWLGITYRGDREPAARRLREMREKGIYPKRLWR